jgi:hypothetical protein
VSLTSAETATRVSDDGVGSEALIEQLQQAHASDFHVAVVLQTEQLAVGQRGLDAHQY